LRILTTECANFTTARNSQQSAHYIEFTPHEKLLGIHGVWIDTYTHAHLRTYKHIQAHMHTCTFAHLQTYTGTHAHMHVCALTNIYRHTCTHAHLRTYKHIQAHMHTCTFANTNTRILLEKLLGFHVCCSVLQCVAVSHAYCSKSFLESIGCPSVHTLQRTLQRTATHCNALQHTQHIAVHCNTLQHMQRVSNPSNGH